MQRACVVVLCEIHNMDSSELVCTANVEKLTSHGIAQRKNVYKGCRIILGRDQFSDIVLRVVVKDQIAQSFLVKEINIHRRFVKEGKATIKLLAQNVLIMLSNCPPDKLAGFLACLKVKLALKAKKGFAGGTQRLRSTLPRSFDHISPLVEQDLLKAKENIDPKMYDKTPKRKRCETGNEQRKRLMVGDEDKTAVTKSTKSAIKLNKSQLIALNAVKSGQNVFITGSGGTGKSFLMKKIIGFLPPHNTFVTASTGVSACQIGGMTLHSFAGIGGGKASLEDSIAMASTRLRLQQWKTCQHLIIDEISMIDAELFDKIEAVARAVRKCDKPFGGIQLIICGDFLQLPPVVKTEKRKFSFQAESWSRCVHQTIELMDVKRQADALFVTILNNIRVGRCTDEMFEKLNETKNNTIDSKDGILATRLCTHKDDVDQINKSRLKDLPGNVRVFESIDSDRNLTKTLDNCCPVRSRLELKVGAQVLLAKNLDVSQGLVNGARGIVKKFSGGNTVAPVVKFSCGLEKAIKAEKWTIKTGGGGEVTRTQVPLQLAWAISIHKSQGMTLDCVEISLARVFECGQAYVALSRAKSLNGLRVLDFSKKCIRAHPEVLKYYIRLRRQAKAAQHQQHEIENNF